VGGQTTNSWGTTLAQLNYQGIWGPPEGLFAVNSTTLGEGRRPNAVIMVVAERLSATRCTARARAAETVASVYQSTLSMPAQYAVPPGQLTFGVWHELVCHIHFAVDSSGVFECWHKLKGQTAWTKTGAYTGYPTVQWTSTPKLPDEDRRQDRRPTGPATRTPWTQYEDGFRAGTSFNARRSHAPVRIRGPAVPAGPRSCPVQIASAELPCRHGGRCGSVGRRSRGQAHWALER